MRIAGVAQRQCKRFVSERLWVQLLPPAPVSKARTGQARRAHARIAQLEEPPVCTWRDARSIRCCGLQLAPFVHAAGHRFGKAERQVRDLRGAPFLASVAQMAGGASLRRKTVRVRIPPGAPLYARSRYSSLRVPFLLLPESSTPLQLTSQPYSIFWNFVPMLANDRYRHG